MAFHRSRACAAVLAGLGVTGVAGAGEHDRAATPLLPQYRQECAACHIAYPPRLLPAASWQRLLSDLPHHFGTDASLDPKTVTELSVWLAANAGRSAAPPQDRITTSAWFVREHREVPAGAWTRPAVKGASNCVACHAQAEQGDFNEHAVRIPN